MTLPNGWASATIADIADTKLGKMLDAAKNKGDAVPYLRNVNVRWGSFDLADLYEMRVTNSEYADLAVQDGDVFVCEGGEPGRSAVWRGGAQRIVFQKALHRIRPFNGMDPAFIAYYLQYAANGELLSDLLTGTTIKHLPQVGLQRLRFNVPPTVEQHRIVAKIELLLGRARRVRTELSRVSALGGASAAQRLLHRLEFAILAKAFCGELVSQDPNDEPASVLLDRIRAERAATPKVKRARMKRQENHA